MTQIQTAYRAYSPQDFLAALGTVRLLGPGARIWWPTGRASDVAIIEVPGERTVEAVLDDIRARLATAAGAFVEPTFALDGSVTIRPDGRVPMTAEQAAADREMSEAAMQPPAPDTTVTRADVLSSLVCLYALGDGEVAWRTAPWDLVRYGARANIWSALEKAFATAARKWRRRDPIREAVLGPRVLADKASARWESPEEVVVERREGSSHRLTAAGVVALAAVGAASLPTPPRMPDDDRPLRGPVWPLWAGTRRHELPRRLRWPIPVEPVSYRAWRALCAVNWWWADEAAGDDGEAGPMDPAAIARMAAPYGAAVIFEAAVAIGGLYGSRSLQPMGPALSNLADWLGPGAITLLSECWSSPRTGEAVAPKSVQRWLTGASPLPPDVAADALAWGAMAPTERRLAIDLRVAAHRAALGGLDIETNDNL